MGAIKNRAIERVVMGMAAGGQIPIPAIEAYFKTALQEFYRCTECVETELTAIDEVKGTKEYTIPVMANSGRIARIVKVERDGAELNDYEYQLKIIVPSDGTAAYEALQLLYESPATATGSLVVTVIGAYDVEDFIPGPCLMDAEIAVASRVIAYLCNEDGKPWSNPNRVTTELMNFNKYVSIAYSKILRGNTGGSVAMRTTNRGFVI